MVATSNPGSWNGHGNNYWSYKKYAWKSMKSMSLLLLCKCHIALFQSLGRLSLSKKLCGRLWIREPSDVGDGSKIIWKKKSQPATSTYLFERNMPASVGIRSRGLLWGPNERSNWQQLRSPTNSQEDWLPHFLARSGQGTVQIVQSRWWVGSHDWKSMKIMRWNPLIHPKSLSSEVG